jgi:hypothetical protein
LAPPIEANGIVCMKFCCKFQTKAMAEIMIVDWNERVIAGEKKMHREKNEVIVISNF